MKIAALNLSASLATFEFGVDELVWPRQAPCWMADELRLGPIPLTPRILSVALTHLSAIYDIILLDLEYALVLEDDVFFQPLFPDQLSSLISNAPSWWDIIFLSQCYPEMAGAAWNGGGKEETPGLWRMPTSRCADAYLISQEGARKLLSSMPLRFTNDHHLNIVPGTAFYWADPFLCSPDPLLPSLLSDSKGVHER